MGADTWSTTTTWNGCAARSTASATRKQRAYASTACRRPKSVRGSQSPRTCTHGARWPSAGATRVSATSTRAHAHPMRAWLQRLGEAAARVVVRRVQLNVVAGRLQLQHRVEHEPLRAA